ncbi:MAG TPA: M28 family peptidase [Candidatus Hydrogenedentes bacterium]|nr:M28 family peptidase [Candidatus Hydrogenedentota bacterium]
MNTGGTRRAFQKIGEDLRFLAGCLPHRVARTEEEAEAAEYIESRLRDILGPEGVESEAFEAPENAMLLRGSIMLEFVVVSLIATWWPLAGAAYGAVVALVLTLDLLGFPIMERLVPSFTSRNIVGACPGVSPREMLVFTAHYDSGMVTPMQRLAETVGTRKLYLLVVGLAVQVVGACLVEGILKYHGLESSPLVAYRWAATWGLLGAGLLHFLSGRGEPSRGANYNASGVAALLALAERLHERPLWHYDVLVVFPGAHRENMAGLRTFLARCRPMKAILRLIHVEGVGMGTPAYVTEEGEFTRRADSELVAVARTISDTFGAVPVQLHRPAGAWCAIGRGYPAITITSADSMGRPGAPAARDDSLASVSEERTFDAARFVEAMARELDNLACPADATDDHGPGDTDANHA